MHVFKYSRRDGTVAAKMPNQIDGNIKEERGNGNAAVHYQTRRDTV